MLNLPERIYYLKMTVAPEVDDSVIVLRCRIVSGRGIAQKQGFLSEPLLIELLGAVPFPGTLNILSPVPLAFDPQKALVLNGGRARFWPVTVEGTPCLAHRWRNCPLHVIEIVSATKIRDMLVAEQQEVSVKFSPVIPVSRLQKTAWRFFWEGHEEDYYGNDEYLRAVKRWRLLYKLANQPNSRKNR